MAQEELKISDVRLKKTFFFLEVIFLSLPPEVWSLTHGSEMLRAH